MTQDARFEDGDQSPLRLNAITAQDLEVLSSLVQDAVLQGSDVSWQPAKRRLVLLINRYRWENNLAQPERARALLTINDVLAVRSQGIDPADKDTVFSLLSMAFAPSEDGAGTLSLTLSGDGDIAVDIECLDLTVQDVTRPYLAPSRSTPKHD
jgi:hypothetical protein